ncbi:TPA: ribonuclease III [Candidatus Scatousia excrementigallinarum]|uniref:Ribonuclease 3 n=1 Tax=Candidatus Scatousia excrementigallinarum TaxID=2840935 RepID=A0A9D1EYA1_9BACT|nr:ribonuclease III [Candidatus Scatousia excrementigallinarum]
MTSVAEIFGIKTEENNLFEYALTHPSYTKENNLSFTECYERLEFLGDSVLKLLISELLYTKYPEYSEGDMSKIRSIVVSDNTLSKIAINIGLDKLIKAGIHDEKQGVTRLESVTACAFEAILGAYYLNGKLQELKGFASKVFTQYIEEVDKNFEKYNAKAILQEYTQSLTKEIPVYKLLGTKGPEHHKIFEIEVSYRGEAIATGEGRTKKDAEQNAAYEACKKLGAICHK